MAIVSIPLAGQIGLVSDVAPAELQPNAWSNVMNARFKDGGVVPVGENVQLQLLPFQPEWALSVRGPRDFSSRWVIAGATEVYAMDGMNFTDITPDGTFDLPQTGLNWSGGVLGNAVIMHHSALAPWAWVDQTVDTKMVPLANWPSETKAYTIRSFKQYLVALGVTKGTSFYPTMVKWSHPADPGSVPVSWDETDPTMDAGETVLAETPGQCIDCVPLRDVNIIYKQDSVWGMQYIGGTYIFRFYKIFGDFGIPSRNCAIEFTAGKHFVFTGTDLIIHDGSSMQSVATGKVKSILQKIDARQLPYCYVVSNPGHGEVWLCYQRHTGELGYADTALVYNYNEGQFSLRDLFHARYIVVGRVDPNPAPEMIWDTDTGIWEDDDGVWAAYDLPLAAPRLLGLGDNRLYWVDAEELPAPTPYVERACLGFPVRASAPPDLSTRKFVRRIWPRFTGTTGATIEVTLGAAENVAEAINWGTPQTFTLGTTRHLDYTLSGKVFALRIVGISQQWWKYSGLDADVTAMGEL